MGDNFGKLANGGRCIRLATTRRGVEALPIGSGNGEDLRSQAIAGSNGGLARQVGDGRFTTCESPHAVAGGRFGGRAAGRMRVRSCNPHSGASCDSACGRGSDGNAAATGSAGAVAGLCVERTFPEGSNFARPVTALLFRSGGP